MKNAIQVLMLFILIACKAQTPIIPLLERPQNYGQIAGAYHKDVTNFLNNFEGTWVWQNGNTSLTLQFLKVEQYQSSMPITNVTFYEDFLIGEYKYIENGVEVVNTLNLFNNSNSRTHSIWGGSLLRRLNRPKCHECGTDEIRVSLSFKDPERPFLATLVLRHGVQWWNQQEYIEARLFISGTYTVAPGAPTGLRVPDGVYTLLKQ